MQKLYLLIIIDIHGVNYETNYKSIRIIGIGWIYS